MTPRGPAVLIAADTSSGDRGTSTVAVVGAVRPQPRKLMDSGIAGQGSAESLRGRGVDELAQEGAELRVPLAAQPAGEAGLDLGDDPVGLRLLVATAIGE